MTDREGKVLQYFGAKMCAEYVTEAPFLKLAKEFVGMLEHCLVVREAAATVSGVADILLCYNGLFIAAELKAINNEPSPQQLKFIQDVRAAGGRGAVCRTLYDIWDMLQSTVPKS